MAFSKRFALTILASFSLLAGTMFGCDSDDENDDGGQKQEQNTDQKPTAKGCYAGKQGFDSNCTCLNTETDWSKQGKSQIIDYLVSVCKLSTKYQDSAFVNAPVESQNIGASCFCYGHDCNQAGYERPELQPENNNAILYGCDNVPENYNGAVRSCFRSTSIDTIKPAIYFPFGACALTMSKCTPSEECDPYWDGDDCTPDKAKKSNEETICSFATFGTYDTSKFTSCPDDSVLMDFVMNIHIENLGRKAKLDVRGCFKGCETDADCHNSGDFDPITQEISQYKCVETDPAIEGEFVGKKAKVCFDKRTIVDADSSLTLVNPGNYGIE